MAAKKKAASRRDNRKESPDLNELLVLELQEIHSAENQLARIIPRVVKAANSEELGPAIEERLQEGEQIITDVEAALERLEESPGRKKNVAAEGLVNDLREHLQEIEAGPALDAVLIAALQKTEHYCIAAWGTVKAMANVMGDKESVRAMERALKEGKAYDERLTEIAEQVMGEITSGTEGEEDEEASGEAAGGEDDDEAEESGGGARARAKGKSAGGSRSRK